MRILEDTPDRLVIEDAPWVLAVFLIALTLFGAWTALNGINTGNWVVALAGLAFALGCPIAFAKAVRRARLTLDRATDQATWRVRDWRGFTEQSWPLDALGRAFLHIDHDDGPKSRVMFTVSGQDRAIPVTIYHSSMGNPGAVAEKINRFLFQSETEDRV